MPGKPMCVVAGLAFAGMLCVPSWATQVKLDKPSVDPCPAATKWIAAKKREMAASRPPAVTRPPAKPELRRELAERVAADQKARQFMLAGKKWSKARVKAMQKVDTGNLAWLKPLVHAHGFPTIAEVGKTGVADAWLLVQHADSDPAFQARVLKELKPRVGSGGIARHDYALLVDRVRLAQGKKQLYGSQFTLRHGTLVLRPTQGMTHLDQRRASMDLMPLKDYACVMSAAYKKPLARKR